MKATELDPVSPTGQARAEAEGIYLQLFERGGFPTRICRVPGIYGPGRTRLIASFVRVGCTRFVSSTT